MALKPTAFLMTFAWTAQQFLQLWPEVGEEP
jgi:hypothetical protein